MDRTRLTDPLAHRPARNGGAIFLSRMRMSKHKRSDDWGFPRWRSYGAKGRDAAKLRLCDRDGCNEIGDRPAPKAPNSKDRWYFCEAHAAEYNKNWNYFAGLSPEEAAKRASDEEKGASGFR